MLLPRLLTVLALVCACAAPAAAQTNDDEDRARAHFLAGQSYYDQASYSDALKEFNEAYRISKKPALLYNVARCFEGLGQYADAVAMLERYLQEAPPDANERLNIEERIRHLRERPTPPPPAPTPPPPPPAPVVHEPPPTPPPLVVTAPPPPERSSRPGRRWAWITGGIGVAALGAALGTGIASQLDYDSLHDDCPSHSCGASVGHVQSRIDDGKRLSLATDILWPIGAAAVVTSVVLFIVEARTHGLHRAQLQPGSIVAHF